MSTHLGSYAAGDTIYHAFTTIASTGAASALSSGAVAVYKNNGLTEDISGITLTADFDARTGLNMLAIDTSADAVFFTDGGSFTAILTAGTVDSVSVVGYVVCRFDLRAPKVDAVKVGGATPETAATIRAEIDTNSTQLAKLGTPAGASMSADIAAVKAETATILVDTGTTLQAEHDATQALIAGLNDIDVAAIFAHVTEGTLTLEQLCRIVFAILAGKVSGAGTGTEVFRNQADLLNRVTVTADVDGNRTAVTFNLT